MGDEEKNSTAKPLFRDINADDDDPEVMQIESFCVGCESQGLTKLFLTKIPFFREVIVSSFTCEECGLQNSELQPGGTIQEKGIKYSVNIRNKQDLNRQVVQTNTATLCIPNLELEIPPNKGGLTTVEGILDKAIEGLSQDQPVRKIMHPEDAAQIEAFIEKLQKLRQLENPFILTLDDPSGNSFIENPYAPSLDPDLTTQHYKRNKEQNEMLCIQEDTNEDQQEESEKEDALFTGKEEVMVFQSNCSECKSPCETHMKIVDIPHFKEVVIMAMNCDICGNRENEVKGGSGIEPKGVRLKLKLTKVSDLSRDVLKSDSCSFSIPELDFTAETGTLGGKFTTLEGLLIKVKDQLMGDNPFFSGDSSNKEMVKKIEEFCSQFDKIIKGELLGIHIVLDDPSGNSYLQNVYAPEEDPELQVTHYERSFEQNEELGLNDMKTENYGEDS